MRNAFVLATLVICSACSAPDQETVRTVAAIEVPFNSPADHADLVSILRRHASADGDMHVDDVSDSWRKFEAENGPTLPGGKGTIYAGVWRGANDDELIADISDMGHPGRVWVTFVKGEHVARATRFRQGVLADIRGRWPDAKAIPVLPSGGVPLAEDLVLTAQGYQINPAVAPNYELSKSSPMVAHK